MQNSFRTILVDDERLARLELRSMLNRYENIEVVDETEKIEDTIASINKNRPDVVFLDIQIQGGSGFDLLSKIDPVPQIIFVTAYDNYALRAFDIDAVDYLLKPIAPERLEQAIRRLNRPRLEKDHAGSGLDYDDRLFITLDNEMLMLRLRSLVCIHAAGDYTEIVMNSGRTGLVLKTMKEWERRLPGNYFIRIHRSTIINMEYVDRVEEWFNYSYQVFLKGVKSPLMMSRRYAAKLKQIFG